MYIYKTDQIVIAACICINKPKKDTQKLSEVVTWGSGKGDG